MRGPCPETIRAWVEIGFAAEDEYDWPLATWAAAARRELLGDPGAHAVPGAVAHEDLIVYGALILTSERVNAFETVST